MKKYLLTASLVAMTVAMPISAAWSAGIASDAALVKLQSPSIPTMRQSIASAAGCVLKSVELKHTAHQLTATVVNSNQNDATSIGRAAEAISIAGEVERAMRGKAEFENVAAIHVHYISRLGKKVNTIQMFEFFRSPANAFVLHKS
jgi:hypothetical protein